ncbi:MAG: hypothetical protein WBE37_15000 [Bryobacteraceae bacterium]
MASPLAVCLIQAALTRIIRLLGVSLAPQLVVLGTVLLGNLPMVWLAWKLAFTPLAGNWPAMACGVVLVLLTYNALGFLYFNLLNLSETSLHVHILMDLLLSGSMPAGELAARYGVDNMIETRIERMIQLGQLQAQGASFVVNNRSLLHVGRVIHFWRKLLRLPLTPT